MFKLSNGIHTQLVVHQYILAHNYFIAVKAKTESIEEKGWHPTNPLRHHHFPNSFSCFDPSFLSPTTTTSSLTLLSMSIKHNTLHYTLTVSFSHTLLSCFCLNCWIHVTNIFTLQEHHHPVYI